MKIHISVHKVASRFKTLVTSFPTSVLTQVKFHISEHNVAICFASLVISAVTSALKQVKTKPRRPNAGCFTDLAIRLGTSVLI